MVHKATCFLHPLEEDSITNRPRGLHIPARMMTQFGLADGSSIVIRLPGFRLPMTIHSYSPRSVPSRSRLLLPSSVLRRLNLPTGWPLQLRSTAPNELHIGPFVGIFCQRYPGASRYGPQTRFFRQLIRMGHALGMFVYVFESGDIDRQTNTVYGSTWLPHRGWVRTACPLPHVVYDRGMVTGSVMRAHRWLRLHGVQQFNSYVGSKLWVYRLMAEVPDLAQYIPETRVLRKPADLAMMVRRHRVVYVKSAHGGKGIGIWVISKDATGGYVYRFTDAAARVRRGRTNDVSGVAWRLLGAPRQPWLIQPRLELLQWRGRIFDARILVQRDGNGQLEITGTAARIGRQGSIISNIFGGGDARPLRPLLQECLGLSERAADEMHERIEAIALQVSELIDRATRRTGTVGELGVDIAIDRAGRLWFLEANSRTGRNVFGMSGMHDRAQLAMERPLHYAAYVAGFHDTDPEEPEQQTG